VALEGIGDTKTLVNPKYSSKFQSQAQVAAIA